MITVCTGFPGAGKSLYVLLKITQELKRGREVFLRRDDSFPESVSNLIGDHQLLHRLDDQQAKEFWRHVNPGSFVVIDDCYPFLSLLDRGAFLRCWFSEHLLPGTDLFFIDQSGFPLAKFFHHFPGDPLLHKSVNVDKFLSITRHRLFSLRFYTVKGAAVDNSYLNQLHFDRQPGFQLSNWQFCNFYLLRRTVEQISRFFAKEASK